MVNFTEALAEEGREQNITANIVIRSIVDTSDNRKAMPNADFDNWIKPEMIEETILFLCSDVVNEISGAVITIYGES